MVAGSRGIAADGGYAGLGALGRRLLLAFALVALTAVGLVTAAAMVGTDRGLASQQSAQRRDAAGRAAQAAAAAYEQAGGWSGADLAPVTGVAGAAGARLTVRDGDGGVVATTQGMGAMGAGPGMGSGRMAGAGTVGGTVTAPVVVAGTGVGSVTLTFVHTVTLVGRPVAWTWILAASVAALALALGAAWFIARQLTRPVVALTAAARAFGGGDRNARAGVRGVGELAELAAAFDDAATTVQRSEHVRRQMAADVAHELRTPLAALQAGLEELRDGLAPADPPALARLHDQSLRLARVVSDLAELSAAEAAPLGMHLEPVDLADVAEAEIRARDPQLRAAGLTTRCHLDRGVVVSGDPHRLHQVIGNLLENCTRYCRPGDDVTVSVTTGSGGSPVRLTVADTGPGIPRTDLPHVFTRFWRARASQTPAGSGLGLAVVQSLVHAHAGRVTVDSDGVHGTIVVVELPRR